MWIKWHFHNNKTSCAWTIWIYVNVRMRIRLYTLFQSLNIYRYKQKYITGIFKCDVATSVFRNNIFNVCIKCILFNVVYIIHNFYGINCNVTAPLAQYCVISNVPLYGVSYLKEKLWESMTLYPSLKSWCTILLFWRMFYLLICACFCWHINYQFSVYFIRIIVSW